MRRLQVFCVRPHRVLGVGERDAVGQRGCTSLDQPRVELERHNRRCIPCPHRSVGPALDRQRSAEAVVLHSSWLMSSVRLAVDPNRTRVAAVVKQAGWSVSVVPCCSDFLDPVVLAYGVDGVPTTFVLGPDGMLLGRDQGAQEIVHLLKKLR